MTARVLICLVAFLSPAVLLAGETGKIVGRVVDQRTGDPLVAANVIVSGVELGAATDDVGRYIILNVPVGRHAVEASMLGYRTMRVTDVHVEADRTAGVDFRLEETAITMPKVVVRAERPMVSKEMVAARYAVQSEDIMVMPGHRLSEVVFFTPAVARTESTFHVRGGRSTEVDYLIDGVSVVDPLDGEFGVELSRGVADEVVFMPGGFSAEYGRVMSGVLNMITVSPRPRFSAEYRLRSEEPMPEYYDFGYTDQGAQVHLPVARGLRLVLDGSVSTTDDWDPRLFVLPHKSGSDYSLYGKMLCDFSGALRLSVSGAVSRSQFDRYKSEWQLRLDEYRSDLRHGNLAVGRLTWMPNSRSFYTAGVSRFHTDKTLGIREPGPVDMLTDFRFRDSSEYEVPGMDMNNPWGTPYESYWYFYTFGNYEEFRTTSSDIWAVKLTGDNQVADAHQVSVGANGDFYTIGSDWTRWPAFNPVRDSYRFGPASQAVYVQDKIEYEGLFANLGLRFDRFDPAVAMPETTGAVPPEDSISVPAKWQVSPRLGASFRITEWLFARANYGHYFQVPLFSALYDNSVDPVRYRTMYGDSIDLVVGNPNLRPERTQSYEVGLQGEVASGLLVTANLWRKDVRDLVGTRTVLALPRRYVTYENVDFAKLTGLELIFEVRSEWFATKLSYTYSQAIGTSSHANEAYEEFLRQGDTIVPAVEYVLDFDQPHRAFLQVDARTPEEPTGSSWLDAMLGDAALHLLGYVGTGFPYTLPEEKLDPRTWNTQQGPVRSNVDAVVTKGLSLGRLDVELVAEVLNVLDIRDILYVYPSSGEPDAKYPVPQYYDFQRQGGLVIRFGDPDYDSRRDFNHDGYLDQYEEYRSTWFYHRATIDWVNNYGPPRRARFGFRIRW